MSRTLEAEYSGNAQLLFTIYCDIMGRVDGYTDKRLQELESVAGAMPKPAEYAYYYAFHQLISWTLILPICHLVLALTIWHLMGHSLFAILVVTSIHVVFSWWAAFYRWHSLRLMLSTLKTGQYCGKYECCCKCSPRYDMLSPWLSFVLPLFTAIIAVVVIENRWVLMLSVVSVPYFLLDMLVWYLLPKPEFIKLTVSPDRFNPQWNFRRFQIDTGLDQNYPTSYIVEGSLQQWSVCKLIIKEGMTDPLSGAPLKSEVVRLNCGHLFDPATITAHYETVPVTADSHYERTCPACGKVVYRQNVV